MHGHRVGTNCQNPVSTGYANTAPSLKLLRPSLLLIAAKYNGPLEAVVHSVVPVSNIDEHSVL